MPFKMKETMKIKMKGKHNSVETQFKKGITPWNKGKKMPQITGENNYLWIKDRTTLKRYSEVSRERGSPAHHYWSKMVKERDLNRCKINNADCDGRIESHHILSWKEHPELRYDVNNGITLCHFHHPKVREEEKRLIQTFNELVSVSKEPIC
jgi:hypothetical protein